jgi:choline kinase
VAEPLKKALILAAGQGSRLSHVCGQMPKCMVPVLGKPMIESTLESLSEIGVEEAVLVTGHLEEKIRDHLGVFFRGIKLTYVSNPDYSSTNNIYSLWLARHLMDRDMLLLECDLVFDYELVARLAEAPAANVAVVDRYHRYMDGTVLFANGSGLAHSMVLKRDQEEGFDFTVALKTVNIYKFSHAFLNGTLIPALTDAIESRQTDDYYEAVIAELIGSGDMALSVLPVDDLRWAEIDTPQDLEFAWEVFGGSSGKRAAGR